MKIVNIDVSFPRKLVSYENYRYGYQLPKKLVLVNSKLYNSRYELDVNLLFMLSSNPQ